MKTIIKHSVTSCFLLSLLFHLLLLGSFVVVWVQSIPDVEEKKSPSMYVPSYAYTEQEQPTPEQQEKQESQEEAQPREALAIGKSAETPAPKKPEKHNYKSAHFSRSSPAMDLSSEGHEEPIHLVGEDKIVKPLIVLLGKALTAKLTYPKSAVDLNVRGVAYVGFQLHPDGTITDVQLVKTSNADVLDEAALAAVAAISPLKQTSEYLKQPEFMMIAIIFG